MILHFIHFTVLLIITILAFSSCLSYDILQVQAFSVHKPYIQHQSYHINSTPQHSHISTFSTILKKNKNYYQQEYNIPSSSSLSTTTLCNAKKSKQDYLEQRWLPTSVLGDSYIEKSDSSTTSTSTIASSTISQQEWERLSIEYLGVLIKTKLSQIRYGDEYHPKGTVENQLSSTEESLENDMNWNNTNQSLTDDENDDESDDTLNTVEHEAIVEKLVKGRFRDLTSSNPSGEDALESLFKLRSPRLPSSLLQHSTKEEVASIIIKGSIVALQSLLILGTQVGLKGSPLQQERFVQHLDPTKDDSLYGTFNRDNSLSLNEDWDQWDNKAIRRLKHRVDTTAGMQLLAELKRKRSSQGAFDLMVQLRFWTIHEDLPLIRSGFPITFTPEEQSLSWEAELSTHDADEILGIRRDLRHLKVYTIDGKSTLEIDDGLSVERITTSDSKDEDESTRYRLWIHIADADKWAPRNSAIFNVALQRATSVYLPTKTVSMFPPNLSSGVMSLRADCDSYALSLSVELNADGSIDEKSIEVMPSMISVNYRLTYDEVDEMFDYGAAYFEEWELGVLLEQAKTRRQFRISKGSTEGFVPTPIPQADVRVTHDSNAKDQVDIKVGIEMTHNSGFNSSSVVENQSNGSRRNLPPLSPSYLLVTEMMILAGESMGKFRNTLSTLSLDTSGDEDDHVLQLPNQLNLPYRTQAKADFGKRYQELNTLESLRDRGDGYCHAWYARRFFEPVRVMTEPRPHTGLGLDCYVQWTSPIRRFSDLQVHAAVKRYLRLEHVNKLIREGKEIPTQLRNSDLGCLCPSAIESTLKEEKVKYEQKGELMADYSIDFKRGAGFVGASRMVQRNTKEYWLFEYIKRMVDESKHGLTFEATVLACVDPRRHQYAIYVHEIGLEHRYLSEKGTLRTGETIWLQVANVSPRQALLTFTLDAKRHGA